MFIYDIVPGYVSSHIFQQVMEYCRSGHVQPPQGESNGEGDVHLSGLGTQVLTVDDPILTNFEKAAFRSKSQRTPTTPQHWYRNTLPELRLRRKIQHNKPSSGFWQQRTPRSQCQTWCPGNTNQSLMGSGSQYPDTPSPSYSASPTSSGLPATPVGEQETNLKIRGVDTSPSFGLTEGVPAAHPEDVRICRSLWLVTTRLDSATQTHFLLFFNRLERTLL